MNHLNDLFIHFLKDVYFAEKQLVKALPKMASKATSPKLRKAIEAHLEETKTQVDRLEQVFKLAGQKAVGVTCPAIQGLLEEAEEVMKAASNGQVRDASIIAAAQAVEHYEIARYGSLCAWATQLGMGEAAKLLSATLAEEKNASAALTGLAVSDVDKKAA